MNNKASPHTDIRETFDSGNDLTEAGVFTYPIPDGKIEVQEG